MVHSTTSENPSDTVGESVTCVCVCAPVHAYVLLRTGCGMKLKSALWPLRWCSLDCGALICWAQWASVQPGPHPTRKDRPMKRPASISRAPCGPPRERQGLFSARPEREDNTAGDPEARWTGHNVNGPHSHSVVLTFTHSCTRSQHRRLTQGHSARRRSRGSNQRPCGCQPTPALPPELTPPLESSTFNSVPNCGRWGI